ncbi:hypothetical protein AVEN_18996-1 [Araneus ventricosus]|uniref:Uncharacterized protein n=1 Tax=Araneus ventricosus TaxID=182803 RepID=A0A4Y2RDW4_ARAVE|nr:hypothetical protein AVEN_18996-1 [Araneus ventricosus]
MTFIRHLQFLRSRESVTSLENSFKEISCIVAVIDICFTDMYPLLFRITAVVCLWLRGRRVLNLKRNSTKDPPFMLAFCALNYTKDSELHFAGVVRKFGAMTCQRRCLPRHLTNVEDYEIRSKITLVCFETVYLYN